MVCETISNVDSILDNPDNDILVVINKAFDVLTGYFFEFRAFGHIFHMNFWSILLSGVALVFIFRAVYGLYDAKFGKDD